MTAVFILQSMTACCEAYYSTYSPDNNHNEFTDYYRHFHTVLLSAPLLSALRDIS
jgi:hypothetical protein